MASTTKTQDVSNCLMVPFQPDSNGKSPGSWSLCYNQSQNTLSMTVDLSPPGSIMETDPLVSNIDSDGLKDMTEFLYQVNMWMQQANSKASTNG